MSDPTAPQDPYAAGREPEPPSSADPPPPPPYGAEPPAAGEQPPAYGTPPPPPAYGAPQPPAYGAPPPPAYGGQPPAYGAPPPPPAYDAQPPGYGAPPPAPAPGAYGYPAQPPGYAYPKNSLGVWALVLGLVSIGCGFFAGIPAIIVGSKAKRAAAEGLANNAGMGTAGIVLGWISTIGSLLVLVLIIIGVASGGWSNFHEFGTMGTN
ncbi:DUF4190 domain-containing protein [Pengzhenrongella sp.]|jgi:hypothetical protein|uniref:DUF4190 domain-containing protein n=1 Tax=Pengzhenrongella sp. TaxID=2888820 RepID=UPI002F95195A